MIRKKTVLLVDDEPNIGTSLRLILEREGYAVLICRSAADFRELHSTARADAYLIDVKLPDGSGIDLLRQVREVDDAAPVVMISGHSAISDAVEAVKNGAFDFLEKPLGRDKVLVVVKNAIEQGRLRQENLRFRELTADVSAARLIGASQALLHAVEMAQRVAPTDARVLLEGESGTGKELLAALIHRESLLADAPFIKVNCAAIPAELIESELFGHEKGAFTGATSARRGRFELADGGTIFMDEIGDLVESAQAKLLRVIEGGEFQRLGSEKTIRVQVRVISATNRNLSDLVAQGRFREDLYYRLRVVPIPVPPLRDRKEDIVPLAEYFLADFSLRNNFRTRAVDAAVFEVLRRYAWPGNVRELKNTVERMAILCRGDCITPDCVPIEMRLSGPAPVSSALQETRETAERERILRALDQTGGNVSAAARILNVERTSLHKRIRALDLKF